MNPIPPRLSFCCKYTELQMRLKQCDAQSNIPQYFQVPELLSLIPPSLFQKTYRNQIILYIETQLQIYSQRISQLAKTLQTSSLLLIVMDQETHPNGSFILLQSRGVIKRKIKVNACTVHVLGSQIDLILEGDRNKLKLTEAAGKIAIVGNENQVEVEKAWITGRVEGNMNHFALVDSQFQLASYRGEGNHIPRILQNRPQNHNHRALERINNMRRISLQRSNNVKRLVPLLPRSPYNSALRQCSICYDDIKQGEEVTSLFCFHLFHSPCIEACLETAVKCPVCTYDLNKAIAEQIRTGVLTQVNEQLVMKESQELPKKDQ